MAKAFVIQNQLGQYFTRKGEWVSGKDASVLFQQPHYDQALNQLIEINSKDIELRGKVLEVGVDENKRPLISEYGPDPVQPELLQEEAKASASSESTTEAIAEDGVAA